MPFLEKNINSPEQEVPLENKNEEYPDLRELKDDYSKEIRSMKIDNDNLNSNSQDSILTETKGELDTIKQEENNTEQEWEKISAEIIDDNEAVYTEGWRSAVENYFGVIDFDIENFKRSVLDEEAYAGAYNDEIAAGGNGQKTIEQYHIFINGETYDIATKCFEAMQTLEEKKPGAVKLLHEKFGISNFQRYPLEILLQQIGESDPEKENAFLAFSESDHNGAFDNQGEIWKKIYTQQQAEFNFRIVECNNKEKLVSQLMDLQSDSEKQISLMFLSAHGEAEGVLLGGDDEVFIKEDLTDIKKMFSAKAQIIANACSAGDINGWLRSLSREAGVITVGPDRPAGIVDIDFIGKEIVPKYSDQDIYSGFRNGFLLTKKKF